MKVAVIGAGPLGLESALHLTSIGAEVTLFSDGNRGGAVARICDLDHDLSLWNSWNQVTSKIGREFLTSHLPESKKVSSLTYLENYFMPIYEKLNLKGKLAVSEDVCSRHICLPIYPNLTSEEQKHVVKVLLKRFF